MGSSGMFVRGTGGFGGAVVIASVAVACSNARKDVSSGVPPGPKGVALAYRQDHPISIAVQGTNIYWTNRGTSPAFDDGSIVKMPIDGGEPIVLASGLCDPSDIAVDDSSVYWTDLACGHPVTTKKMSSDGGSVATLASDCGISITVAGGFVFCFQVQDSPASVTRIPAEGGTPTAMSAPEEALGLAITADRSNVYWARAGGYAGLELVKMPLEGGEPIVVVPRFKPAAWTMPIASDGTRIYWTDSEGDEVKAVSVDGGSPALVAAGQGRVIAIATWDDRPYWSTCPSSTSGSSNPGTIARASEAGGSAEILALLDSCAEDIAVDGEAVYWVDHDAGRVWTVALD